MFKLIENQKIKNQKVNSINNLTVFEGVKMNLPIEEIQKLIKEVEELKYNVLSDEKFNSIQRRADIISRAPLGNPNLFQEHFNELSYRTTIRKSEVLLILKDMLFALDFSGNTDIKSEVSQISSKVMNLEDIFIVHGHDNEMKYATALAVKDLGLNPIILHEQANKGKTIIEKFMDNSNNVSFAVILLSPDDLAYSKEDKSENAKLRARQNVILELGYFLGKLGRERVFVLYREDTNFEMPSDYQGVLYVPYDSLGHWIHDLIKELKACDYDV